MLGIVFACNPKSEIVTVTCSSDKTRWTYVSNAVGGKAILKITYPGTQINDGFRSRFFGFGDVVKRFDLFRILRGQTSYHLRLDRSSGAPAEQTEFETANLLLQEFFVAKKGSKSMRKVWDTLLVLRQSSPRPVHQLTSILSASI